MNLVQIIKYEGDNTTFVWKHPCEDFNTSSQLIVHESQEAIFFANGQALDIFGPGRHTLETQNIPIIRRVQSIPSGGETPFHCEVYFINKTEQMAIKWGTDSKVQYTEPTYGFPISIGASGEMSLRVEDSRKMLIKLVGTEHDLTQSKLVNYFRGILMTRVKAYIAQVMKNSAISIFEVDEQLNVFSDALKDKLYNDFLEYGVSLERFFVTNVVRPDGEASYERFKKIFFEESIGIREEKLQQQKELIRQQTASQRIIMESAAIAQKRAQEGYTYQQERSYDVAGDLARNEGVGNFSSAGIGLGMMAGVGGGMGAAIAGITSSALEPIMGGIPQSTPGPFGVTDFGTPGMIDLKQESPVVTPEPVAPKDETMQSNASSERSVDDFKIRLEKLNMLKQAGLLTDEELAENKAKLLKELGL